MKKEYTRPNMEIVSFATENIAADTISMVTGNQPTDSIKSITVSEY